MGKKSNKDFWLPNESFIDGWDGKKKKKDKNKEKGKDKKNKKKKSDGHNDIFNKKDKKKNRDSEEFGHSGKGNHKKNDKEGMEYRQLLSNCGAGLYKVVSNILDDDLEIYIVKMEKGFPIELTTGENYKTFVAGTMPENCDMSVNKVMYSSRVVPVKIDRTLERQVVEYITRTQKDFDDDNDESGVE